MNVIQRIHNHAQPDEDKNVYTSTGSDAPFWVRHYDMVVNLVTLGRAGAIHQQTLTLADLRPGDAVLDVGCGTGALLLETKKVVGLEGTVVGLDVEPAMVEQARRRADSSSAVFEVASVDRIPYADNTFDVVFSTLMYHHLTEAQKATGIVESVRVLKPGGRLVLVDINPAQRNIFTSLPGHNSMEREDYVRSEVTERMQAAGLTVVADGPHPSKQLSYAIGEKTGGK